MVTFRVVTTMNEKGWLETGQRMVASFVARWPAETKPLVLYAEDFDPGPLDGVEVRRLPEWLDEFKARYGGVRGYNGQRPTRYDYRFDAVKFAHKVAALTDFALELDDGVLIWLDADTFTHANVSVEWLWRLFPTMGYIAWLDRQNSHPECGFVMYRCSHPYHREFMESFRRIYISGDLFKLPETHDSYVLQHLVTSKRAAGKIEVPVSLSGEVRWHHPFINGPLGSCLDHLKGPRKQQGRSHARDMRKPRSEPYWRIDAR